MTDPQVGIRQSGVKHTIDVVAFNAICDLQQFVERDVDRSIKLSNRRLYIYQDSLTHSCEDFEIERGNRVVL